MHKQFMDRLQMIKQYIPHTVVLVVLGTLFAVPYVWPQPYSEALTIGVGAADFKELSNRFEELTHQKGGVYAYEVLRRAQIPPNTDLHLLGHVVGDIFYTQKGISGIADCTQDFRNACSHTIVIGALQEFGAGANTLSLIDDACKKAPGGVGAYTMCYHGLGHGVFAYFGYDLLKTDAFCKKMGTAAYRDEQYTQCMGGAVMELMGGGGHDRTSWSAARKKYLTEDPLAPCTSTLVPDVVKGHCYVYLTPRLLQQAGAVLAHPDPATFPKAFSFCDAIPLTQESLRDSCFGGFGKEFIPLAGARDIRSVDRFSDVEYQTAAKWCELAEASDGKQACITHALDSVFWGGENDPRAAFRFCGLVSPELQDACYKKLSFNIHYYFSGKIRQRWCGELLPVYQDICTLTTPLAHE